MTAILDEELHSGNKIGRLLYLIEKDKRLSRNYRHAANPVSYTHLDVYKRQP